MSHSRGGDMRSTSHSPSCTHDYSLDSTAKTECNRWNIYFLILSLILGAETFITSCLLYDFASDVYVTRESLTHGGYPVDCVHQLADLEDPGGPDTSCDLMKQEAQNLAQEILLLEIRNSLWRTLGEHNITQSFKPAIHLGAKQWLKHHHHLQKTGESRDPTHALEQLHWDSTGTQTTQEGLMLLSADGEIQVPQSGIYFVYSHVHFESTLGLHVPFMQYLFKRTALYPQPLMLSKAGAAPCLSSESGVELYSSQQGALFHLERGDRLSLYVLNTAAVRFPSESTYFGAFMIN
ncbi:tumor necrosis factor (ligand) superfamily, member 10 like 4 [Brachyhypopomus gauderio]|uniref:tumor necrosis factor (ligand) superfamily, member 10 like 4 n=1 Tax=Brachyhypopomus gauderio TaxID=698409 RepID=UPI0040410AED